MRARSVVSVLVLLGVTFAGARTVALQIMTAPEEHQHETQE